MSDWIEWKWTPEQPYPETLDTEVYVKWSDSGIDPLDWKVKDWVSVGKNTWNAFNPLAAEIYITHYKLA